MSNQIVLIIRFWVTARPKPLFVEKLKTLFDQIQHEAAFVNASLSGRRRPSRNNFWSMSLAGKPAILLAEPDEQNHTHRFRTGHFLI